jgi:hypothetical protein
MVEPVPTCLSYNLLSKYEKEISEKEIIVITQQQSLHISTINTLNQKPVS